MYRMFHEKPDIRQWRNTIAELYNVHDIMFFGDFSNQSLRSEITKIREVSSSIIETQNASAFHKKDYTDFIMLDHIYQRAITFGDDTDVFIIFSGDGHFSSVTSFLVNRCNKIVAVYGIRDCLSMQLKNTASITTEWPPVNAIEDTLVSNTASQTVKPTKPIDNIRTATKVTGLNATKAVPVSQYASNTVIADNDGPENTKKKHNAQSGGNHTADIEASISSDKNKKHQDEKQETKTETKDKNLSETAQGSVTKPEYSVKLNRQSEKGNKTQIKESVRLNIQNKPSDAPKNQSAATSSDKKDNRTCRDKSDSGSTGKTPKAVRDDIPGGEKADATVKNGHASTDSVSNNRTAAAKKNICRAGNEKADKASESDSDGDILSPYYKNILTNIKYLEKNNTGKTQMRYTYGSTVDSVSSHYGLDRDMVTVALDRLCDSGYIILNRVKSGFLKSSKTFNVNWDKVEEDKLV